MFAKADFVQQLRGIVDKLSSEWTQLQIVGRELTLEERRRYDQISKALPKLREGLEILTAEVVTEEKSGP